MISDNSDARAATIEITGGTFSQNPEEVTTGSWKSNVFTSSATTNCVAEGYESIDNENGTWTVQRHVCSYDYAHPTVVWRNIRGTLSAIFTYTCSCGKTDTYIATPTYTDSEGERTYTATDEHNHVETTTKTLNYHVTFNDSEQPEIYHWGDVCTLDAGAISAWYVDSVAVANKVADGVSTYTFAVTDNTTIVTGETNETSQQAAVSAKLTAESGGKATFSAKWSIPEGCTVTSVKIYRGYTSSYNSGITSGILTSYGTLHNVNLLVRTGDYKLRLSGLSANTYQYAVIIINYKDSDNETQKLISTVQSAGIS